MLYLKNKEVSFVPKNTGFTYELKYTFNSISEELEDLESYIGNRRFNSLKRKVGNYYIIDTGRITSWDETPVLATIDKENKLVGYLLYNKQKGKAQTYVVDSSYVSNKHRGKGLGLSMYKELIKKGNLISDSYLSKASFQFYKKIWEKNKNKVVGLYETGPGYGKFDFKSELTIIRLDYKNQVFKHLRTNEIIEVNNGKWNLKTVPKFVKHPNAERLALMIKK